MSEKSIFEKEKIDPAIALFFNAFVVKGPPLELDKIKRFILEECNVRLIYQHRGSRYLRIEVAP